MKLNKSIIWSLLLLVVVASLYRIIPQRPYGFAPQWSMAIFAGAIIKDKKWAFLVPVLSMFISDLFYQILFVNHLSVIPGFYEGQWINYILFASVTFFGFLIRKITLTNVLVISLAAPTYFFIVSNFLTWVGVGDAPHYPKTLSGLLECYTLAIPFYKTSLLASLLFSAILFGSYGLVSKAITKTAHS